MAAIDDVRILLGDLPKWTRQTATGDGATKRFMVSSLPIITDTEIVTVNGSAQSSPTNYSINANLGLFTFVAAPGDGIPIVAEFAYAEMSTESLTSFLALNSNIYIAAAMAADALAGKYASQVDKKVGDLSISGSQRAKQWAALAKQLRDAAASNDPTTGAPSACWVGGVSRGERDSMHGNTDYIPNLFRRESADDDYWVERYEQ
jgi:hypothetical protein